MRSYSAVFTMLAAMVLIMLALLVLSVVSPGSVAAQEEEPRPPIQSEPPPVPERAPNGGVVPGQIIVKYAEGTTPADKAALRRQEGLDKEEELGLIDAEVVQVKGRSTRAALRDLNRRPDVEYAEFDYIYHPAGYADEPRFGELWGLDQPSDWQGWQDIDVNAKEASAITQGDPDLVVAVIDTGVDFSHPDLADRAWKNPGESGSGKETNGVDDDGNGYVDDVNGWDFCRNDNTVHDDPAVNPPPYYGHGTHVAGTIAASVNGQGVVGVAPNVQIMALKVCGYASDFTQALGYAKSKGVKIANYSWDGANYSQATKEAIEASGQLFVAPAGNFSNNNDANPRYPASYENPNILSVAGINSYGNTPYSNYGATSVDISAPGEGILSPFPEIPATPAAVLSSVGSSGGKALTTGFGADAIGDSARRASFFTKAFAAVDRGSQQVVLVDDDLSTSGLPDVGVSLSTAIQSATGSAPEVIPVSEFSDGPNLSQLSGKTVVWATGWARYSETTVCFCDTLMRNLTDNDQQTLKTFLEGGGKLILTGQDALTGMENTSFVRDTIKLSVQTNSFQDKKVFNGSSGTAFAGESYDLNYEPFSSTSRYVRHDVLIPTNSATVAQGTYPGIPQGWRYLSGTSMAAAHATGVAALAASQYPSLLSDPTELKQVVMNGGKLLPSTAGRTVTGDIVNAEGVVLGVTNVFPTRRYGWASSTNPTATFLWEMDPNTLNTSTFTLTKQRSTTPVAATVSYDPATRTATLDPSADLETNFTTYTATIKGGPNGAKTATGNALVADKVWIFTTNSTTDTVRPSVLSTDPLAGATDVLRDTNVMATFSEAMNASTLTASTFTLTKQGSSTPVAATANYNSTTKKATLDPSSDLQANTTYTARVKGGSTGAKDLAGNALGQDYTWTFTTAPLPPPPTVVGYTPTQTAGVPTDIQPTATFSTDMKESTITSTTIRFQVYNKRKNKWIGVAHTVGYDAASKMATVTPDSTLAASKKYRVTVTTNVQSSTGLVLDQDPTTSGNQPKVWTFTTESG